MIYKNLKKTNTKVMKLLTWVELALKNVLSYPWENPS